MARAVRNAVLSLEGMLLNTTCESAHVSVLVPLIAPTPGPISSPLSPGPRRLAASSARPQLSGPGAWRLGRARSIRSLGLAVSESMSQATGSAWAHADRPVLRRQAFAGMAGAASRRPGGCRRRRVAPGTGPGPSPASLAPTSRSLPAPRRGGSNLQVTVPTRSASHATRSAGPAPPGVSPGRQPLSPQAAAEPRPRPARPAGPGSVTGQVRRSRVSPVVLGPLAGPARRRRCRVILPA